MKIARKLSDIVSAGALFGLLLIGTTFAQETKAPEPAKVEAPAAPAAPAAEAKKEDPGAAPAQFTQGLLEQIGGAKVAMDTMWTLIAGMLVFFMNLGFATVESGLCRAKNAVTILAKNFIVFAASSIAFSGFGLGIDVRGWQCALRRRRFILREWRGRWPRHRERICQAFTGR